MAETWRALNRNDVLSGMAQLELDSFNDVGEGETITDRLDIILTHVTAEIRSYIASDERNILTEDATLLPHATHHAAVAIVRFRLMSSIAGEVPSEVRKREYDDAQTFLRDIASGKIRISKPAQSAAADAVYNQPSPAISARPRQLTRDNMSGC